jgi:hypothetical protein
MRKRSCLLGKKMKMGKVKELNEGKILSESLKIITFIVYKLKIKKILK